MPQKKDLARPLSDALKSKLIFITGKGGTGKTAVAAAVARSLVKLDSGPKKSLRVLSISFEDPTQGPNQLKTLDQGPHHRLDHLNVDSMESFEEYIGMKLGLPKIASLFVGNKLIRYLAKAAPGLHEMVLLGKLWHERNHYDHIVADMPSSGYTVTMFQSTQNFSKLFGGGPLSRDAHAMLETFLDPAQTSFVIVSLAEEMPLVESLELAEQIDKILPGTKSVLIANRLYPTGDEGGTDPNPEAWESPFAKDTDDFLKKKRILDRVNLGAWSGQVYETLPYVDPSLGTQGVAKLLAPVIVDRVGQKTGGSS